MSWAIPQKAELVKKDKEDEGEENNYQENRFVDASSF